MAKKTSIGVWVPAELAREIDDAAAAQVPPITRSAFLGFVLRGMLAGRAREVYETMVAEERAAAAQEGGR